MNRGEKRVRHPTAAAYMPNATMVLRVRHLITSRVDNRCIIAPDKMHAFVPGARELPRMTAYGPGNGTIHIAELDDHYFRQREDDLWRSGLIGRPERLMLEPKSVRQSSALEGVIPNLPAHSTFVGCSQDSPCQACRQTWRKRALSFPPGLSLVALNRRGRCILSVTCMYYKAILRCNETMCT